MLKILLLVFLRVCFLSADSDGLIDAKDVDIKPGGATHSETFSFKGYICTFTYAAQGGTKEKWHFALMVDPENRITCTIQRENGAPTYLYFMNFKMSVNSGILTDVHVYDGDKLLKEEEYQIESVSKTVESSEIGFQHKVSRVVMKLDEDDQNLPHGEL